VIAPLLAVLLQAAPPPRPDFARSFERTIAAAEDRLRADEPQAAESRYRAAAFEAWLVLGLVERSEGRLEEARAALREAAGAAVEDGPALRALAFVDLQRGESEPAVRSLSRLVAREPKDVPARVLLAHALTAIGEPDKALAPLLEARKLAPGDPEIAFALGGQYLRAKQPEKAAAVFAELVRARPRSETRVLVGRMYRDYGEPARAAAELRAALAGDPQVRRARYYLGLITLADKGRAGFDEAIALFREELELVPGDVPTHLELGVTLVDAQRPLEALPSLERAARSGPPNARTLYYLGRAQLGADQVAASVASLRQALALAVEAKAASAQLRVLHMQLGQAQRRAGDVEEADAHFAEAARLSAEDSSGDREKFARLLADAPEPEAAPAGFVLPPESSALDALSPDERRELKERATATLARAYLNLGVLHAQAERFARAAELIEKAASVSPDFPRVQTSLGIAYFNAGRYDRAIAPLGRALDAAPDPGLRRMLALAHLNTRQYDKAAELLRDDPERAQDPSLEFAYALALVKSDRVSEAEPVFSRLLARHGDSAGLSVLLGQANAQKGDFDAAVESLNRALRYDPDVAEAHGTLGVIYLKQGKLPEAERALRAELRVRPGDLLSQQNLAAALEMQQRPDEAAALLRALLRANPEAADARYLLGKILLAQGAAAEAAEHLEAAARLSPEDANVHYQLGQAYLRLGRKEPAEREFETFQALKAKR
jgi:tetratricopeptide (TPR) repeat protein